VRQPSDEDEKLMEEGSTRKRQATLRFFDTLKSEHGDENQHPREAGRQRHGEAHERRFHGDMEPRPCGEDLEEVNAKRGTACRLRVTPACSERTLRMHKPLKSYAVKVRLGRRLSCMKKRHEGKPSPKGGAATGEGKPLKAEAQGRYRHEARLERLWVE
jgi:hypothetical protein